MTSISAPARRRPRPAIAPLHIQPVWKQVTPGLQQELIAFWNDNNAVRDRGRAAQRAEQAVCLGRDANGVIQATSTAEVRVLPRLLQPMYYFRMFLAKTVRGQAQMMPLFYASRAALQAYNARLPSPESLGVLIELESRFLSQVYTRAYVAEADSTFIGYSPRGLQLRVSYFEGAVLMKPVTPTAG